MSKSFLIHPVLCLSFLIAFNGCETSLPSAHQSKPTFVLVHGAWGGGWDWKRVGNLLTADGYEVYRPTLTGQGEHSNLASTSIDLNTHIQDIVNVIVWEDLYDVVLVGHSYGGMVLTGVADRVPDRIKRLVYVDALLPVNGESVNSVIAKRILQPSEDGFITAPWIVGNPQPPHDVPMPAKTFSEPIFLTNQTVTGKLPATYILTVEKGKTPQQDDFYKFYLRAEAHGWPAWIMEGDHNVQRSHPDALVRLLEKAVR